MTERENLQRDIDILRESIRLGWRDMGEMHMTREERQELRRHLKALVDDLLVLHDRMEALDAEGA